jgi:hypothetical protein
VEVGDRQQSIPLTSKRYINYTLSPSSDEQRALQQPSTLSGFLIVSTHPPPIFSCLFQEDQIVPIMKMFTVLPTMLVALFSNIQAAPSSEAGFPFAKPQVFKSPYPRCWL